MVEKRGPPSPPAKGRPAPPAKGAPKPPSKKAESPDSNHNLNKAQTLENEGKYKEAAILYQEKGDTDSANRCLNLALASTNQTVVNNIQYGDKNIHDSVVMGEDNR